MCEQGLLSQGIRIGNVQLVQTAINAGADVNYTDSKNGSTPLIKAIIAGSKDIAQMLIEAGANHQKIDFAEYTPLGYAAQEGNLEMVKLLLNAGADPDNGGTDSAIVLCVKYAEVAQTLIEAGADVNYGTLSGVTPLMRAVQLGYRKTIKLLIEAGASLEHFNDSGWTALDYAAANNQEIFEYLFSLNPIKN